MDKDWIVVTLAHFGLNPTKYWYLLTRATVVIEQKLKSILTGKKSWG